MGPMGSAKSPSGADPDVIFPGSHSDNQAIAADSEIASGTPDPKDRTAFAAAFRRVRFMMACSS